MPEIITVSTHGKGFVDITDAVAQQVSRSQLAQGVAHLFVQHTSASLVIQENADPDVLKDLVDFFEQLAPEAAPYRHISEGSDDMPAHIRAALTQPSLAVPFKDGALMLGTWQAIYLFEHRRAPHRRRVVVSLASAA